MLAGCVDDSCNLPLHYAASCAKRPGLVRIFAEFYPEGVIVENEKRDMPLHIAASLGFGGKYYVRVLLHINPGGMDLQNQDGKTPLHLACSNFSPSVDSLRNILKSYAKAKKLPMQLYVDGS